MFINDYILNGSAHGPVGQGMSQVHWEPRLRRPYFNAQGVPCVSMASNRTKFDHKRKVEVPIINEYRVEDLRRRGVPVMNATVLRKEEWIQLDAQVLRAARYRLRAWADLAAANSFGGFNGMGKMVLEHEIMSDPGEAMVDMNGLGVGRNDQPLFQLRGLPLPITHADFSIDARKLAISRGSGTPTDTTMGEACGRRVAETIEKTTIGVQTGITYGGASTYVGGYDINSSVFGYVNYTKRNTKTGLSIPTGGSWTASKTLNDVLSCLDTLKAHKFYGPFMVYTSNDWDKYLDGDYILTGGNVATQTLRERLKAIEGIIDVRRLDFLFSSLTDQSAGGPGLENVPTAYAFTMIFVQMTPDVARAVNGMDITTVQWEEKGGMELKFKVMTISVPQLRSDYFGNCGILTATFNT